MVHKEIVIVGGGPVGLSLALEIANQNKKVLLIDKLLNSREVDGRVLALSYASYLILKRLKAWSSNATAIDSVQISHTGLGISNINAHELNINHLGYTIEYTELCSKLIEQVKEHPLIEILERHVLNVQDGQSFATIEYLSQENKPDIMTANLVVMAEGGKLLADESKKINHDYEQQAIVAHIKTKNKSQNIAYERFAVSGPLVLLPFKDHYVMVWSMKNELAEQVKQDPASLVSKLNQEFTNRLGGAQLISQVASFPLKLTQVKQRFRKKIVLIGNSAQTVHPVSAQGLNLGLRDVVMLSRLLATSQQIDFTQLGLFDNLRSKDANAVIGFTHFLATFLERQGSAFNHIRGAGLIALSNLPFAQKFIAKSLIFGV